MQLVETKTSIPIPKILDWSDDASNTIGSEYIIMEHAPGVCLSLKWPDMTEIQRAMVMKPIYQNLKEAANLEFSAYGSLYLANTPHIKDSAIPLDPNFCIGPNCETMYWDCEPTEPRYYHAVSRNQGPCKLQFVQASCQKTHEIYRARSIRLLRWSNRSRVFEASARCGWLEATTLSWVH